MNTTDSVNLDNTSLASENYAGVHPIVLDALIRCNQGHESSYGQDRFTQHTADLFRAHFGKAVQVCYTFNGTGANMFALSAMTSRYHSILCSDVSHVYNSESTAIEMCTGCKLIPLPSRHGKILAETLDAFLKERPGIHSAQPRVLTLTQPTEYGTVYSLQEIKALSAIARSANLLVHVDGARLFNAAASLGCSLQEITAAADVVSLGGTKSGMLFGEAVLFFNAPIFENSLLLLKRSGQLASKMRFIACQFESMLTNNLWYDIATHTNAMATRLMNGLQPISRIRITLPVQTNAVFGIIPEMWNHELMEVLPFYIWDTGLNEARWICSFDTIPESIDRFVGEARKISQRI